MGKNKSDQREHIKRERYISGSNAVAYAYEPQVEDSDTMTAALPNRKPKKRHSINPLYTIILVLLIVLMLSICVMILKAQFTVANTSERVIELKHEVTAIKRSNAHLESIIHEALDLVEIKRTAMEDYGMVFPTEGDVIRITPEASSYTVQFTAIGAPAKERASFGSVLAFITRGW